MVYRPNIDQRLVFVIMPFGAPCDGYYEQILKPVADELGRRALIGCAFRSVGLA